MSTLLLLEKAQNLLTVFISDLCGTHQTLFSPSNICFDAVSDQQRVVQDQVQRHLHAIQTHQDAVLKLHSRWNDLVPIAKLPPEILSEIFITHVKSYVVIDNWDDWHPRHWIAFSHVCRHWRKVALDCPTLWSSINLYSGPDCILEFLSRTKEAPLRIMADPNAVSTINGPKMHEDTKHMLYWLFKTEMWRIYELEMPLLPSFLSISSAGALQKLALYDNEEQPEDYYVEGDLGLPSTIIHGDGAPRLEELLICRCSFEWEFLCHSNLKSLELIREDGYEGLGTTLVNVLEALDSMPLLEKLKIVNCLPMDIQSSRSTDCRITLSHLHEISLSSNTKSCINFLSYLDLPSAKQVSLWGELHGEPSDTDFASIQLPTVFRCCAFNFSEFEFRALLSSGLDDDDDDSSPSLELQNYYGRYSMETVFDILCNTLPLSHTETLSITSKTYPGARIIPPAIAVSDFMRLFAKTHNLRGLRLRFLSDIFSPLSALFGQNDSEAGSDRTPLLTHLKVLEMDSVSFSILDTPEVERLRDRLVQDRNRGIESPVQLDEIIHRDCTHVTANRIAILQQITGAACVIDALPGTSDWRISREFYLRGRHTNEEQSEQ